VPKAVRRKRAAFLVNETTLYFCIGKQILRILSFAKRGDPKLKEFEKQKEF
jgi:hypothetical protein